MFGFFVFDENIKEGWEGVEEVGFVCCWMTWWIIVDCAERRDGEKCDTHPHSRQRKLSSEKKCHLLFLFQTNTNLNIN